MTKPGVWQIDAATSKYEIDIGLPRIGPAVAMLYHHTVVPNGRSGSPAIRGSAKSIPHEVDAEIRPIGGVID